MRHFALPHQNLEATNRRRFLALCLPLAVIPLLSATPLTAALTRIGKTISGVWPLQSKMGEVDYSKPFYLREAPGAVLWLTEHIQTYVAPQQTMPVCLPQRWKSTRCTLSSG
jgi:hypothetical protein